MKRYFNIDSGVSILFVLCLIMPLIVSLIQKDVEMSASEKRKLAKFPEISSSSESLSKFPDEFEAYYDDHFGFRSRIVRLHNYTLSKVFGVSPTPMVVIGSDNWYFLNADGSISDFIGRFPYSNVTLEKFSRLLQDRKKWLNAMGSQYIFMPVPNKETVYPEKLPLRIRKNRGATKYDQILGYLKNDEQFQDFIDTQELLLDRKRQARVFLQTDSHWNHEGTYQVYLELMNRLQYWLPDLVPLKQKKEKDWIENFSGDLTILMNLKGLITEKAPDTNIVQECEPIEPRIMAELKEIPYYSDMAGNRLPVISGCEEKKYKAIFIHDSFGKFLRPYLSQQFKEIIFINYMNFEKAKRLIAMEKPDIVIDQRAARNIQRALRPDPELEQMILKNRFAELTEDIVSSDGAEIFSTVMEKENVVVKRLKSSMVFEFKEKNSRISFKSDYPSNHSEPAAIRIDVDSSQNSTIRFCYTPETPNLHAQSQCSKREVEKGNNQIFLRVVKPEKHGSLEMTAEFPGRYVLNSIVVRREVSSGT